MKILLGILIGVCICIALLFFRDQAGHREKYSSPQQETLNALAKDTGAIATLNLFDEKLNSVNRRFDDLYTLGGVIISLLLAINISIFVRVDSQVDRHFKANFESYLLKIKKYLREAEQVIGTIKITDALAIKNKDEKISSKGKNIS